MLSDEEILKYWRDEKFSGSYRGGRIFQSLLKTDLNEDVPLSRIYKVLSKGSYNLQTYRQQALRSPWVEVTLGLKIKWIS